MRTPVLALISILAPLLLASATALAADPPKDAAEKRYSRAYDKCMDTPENQGTMGMIQCGDEETTRQDAALNAAYKKAMKDLTPGQKAKLQAAERAWIAFRDAECASFEDDDWGTLSRVNANICVLHMTAQRVIDLENYPPST